jgi:hypothetical protein
MRAHFGVQTTPEILGVAVGPNLPHEEIPLIIKHDLDPTLSPFDATNFRKLQISNLSRPVLAACSRTPPDSLAMKAVQDSAHRLASSIVSLAHQICRRPITGGGKVRKIREAGMVLGGGVLRQGVYREAMLKCLKDNGVDFAWSEVVEDVAAEGALGLVEKART